MAYKGNWLGRGKGFTLVELLLVIVLMAVIMALVTLSGSSMIEATNAQTEARRMIRTVQSVRSAWLACYADTQDMPGVPATAWDSDSLMRVLSRYSDRSLSDEAERYGNLEVRLDGERIDVGFEGPWDLANSSANSAKDAIKDMIANQAADYEITFTAATESILIRVR
ncbi:MAG: prepilin-type N-terminal cleavage/methylation domain-containing protein [Synergistaceae bacterium]|jgi:prepilin-type N-terminal cleavage/methylation domain-containing protein|nr:prepilin-type N-terminal cleavage/methylation domain-containing protein [Synergistaceae bacterium]